MFSKGRMKLALKNAYILFQKVQDAEFCDLAEIQDQAIQLEQVEAACELLLRLTYIVRIGDGKYIQCNSTLDQVNANRLALLMIASKFDRAFELSMVQTPAAFFFGAMISPIAFGNSITPKLAVGVGGCGETFQRAFECCCGEAAEYLSFIQQQNCLNEVSSIDCCGLTKVELQWALIGLGYDAASKMSCGDWITANSLHDDRQVKFPYELAIRKPVGQQLAARQSESTGIGAGILFEDAIYSGVLEVIERDAIALWWFGGNSARKIDSETLKHSGILDYIDQTRPATSRQCWFLDITTDLGISTVVALSSQADGSSVVVGYSSHMNQKRALLRALHELCQMEMAQEISLAKSEFFSAKDLSQQDKMWIRRHEELNVANYPQLLGEINSEYKYPDLGSSLNDLQKHLRAVGLEAYYIDLTREHIGIPVAKVLIPGLQSSKIDWVSERLINIAEQNKIDLQQTKNFIPPI